jgi:P27 family predicted phage terminase small subunit
MGRHPTPDPLRAPGRDAQHKADGRLVPRAPAVVRRSGSPVPDPPEGLGARGEIEWNKVWTTGHWLQEDADYHWVLMIAQAYDEIGAFREQIAADGLVVTGYNDQMVAHPLIKEIRTTQNLIIKCLSVLGFSPTDRARLGIQEAQARKAILDLKDAQARNRGDR